MYLSILGLKFLSEGILSFLAFFKRTSEVPTYLQLYFVIIFEFLIYTH